MLDGGGRSYGGSAVSLIIYVELAQDRRPRDAENVAQTAFANVAKDSSLRDRVSR